MNLDHSAIIALGSNLGSSVETLLSAIERLRGLSREPLAVSSLWETEPIDCPPGVQPFTNAVVALAPLAGETPDSLLEKLQALEHELGRQRSGVKNEARVLDLDLIAFGSEVRSDSRLTLPHPRAHQRAFVLAPLHQIAPDYVLPSQSAPVSILLERLTDQLSGIRRLRAG